MLFKSRPLSHRAVIFLAVVLTADPLIKSLHGQTSLRASSFLPGLVLWVIVVFQALQHSYPSWQFGGALRSAPPLLIDTFGSWFDRLPSSIKFTYWLLVIFGAVIIYLVM